jgi:hypothetical protein
MSASRSLSANFAAWRPDEPKLPPDEMRRLTAIAWEFFAQLCRTKEKP